MTEMMRHNGFHPVGEPTRAGPIPLGPMAPMPGSMPVPPPRPPGARATVVLSVLVALLFVAAIGSVVLYVSARGDHDAAVSRLAERKGALAAVNQKVVSTDAALRAAAQRNSGLATEKTDLTTCVDAVQHYLWDGLTGDERTAAVDLLFTVCG